MCIIAAKPAGIKMPTIETQHIMWNNNPDGAGIMYAVNGQVKIQKGFMTWEAYENFITELERRIDTTNTSVVMHFRIKTHGQINQECCHPFPVTRSIEKMKKPKCECTLGVAHNGIIDIVPRKGISDTMEYTATQLAPLYSAMPEFYRNQSAMELVENAIDSKMALLNTKGDIYLIGKFTNEKGINYSNSSYEPRSWTSIYSYDGSNNGAWFKDETDKDYGFKRRSKKLMWGFSFPAGCYIADFKTGEMFDDLNDVAIDKDGTAYVYDWEFDGFESLGCCVYTAEGSRLQYDDTQAEYECVIEW